MDASLHARSGSVASSRVRGACITAVLLCALGVLCGAVVRSAEAGTRHHHHGATVAVAMADTQLGAATRGTQSAVTNSVPLTGGLRLVAVSAAHSSESADQVAAGAARQRGPPADLA